MVQDSGPRKTVRCFEILDVNLIYIASYANTLLVTFNNRVFISRSLEHGPELSGFEVGPSRNIGRTRPIAINVTKSFGDSINLNAFSDGENGNISDLGRMVGDIHQNFKFQWNVKR